ncbi:conserved of plant or bacterial origin [Cryptosporidium sp. chipmunk genotype I]|uniref:conserved of plant or bacterial origin n=1 Tax=Cryptosporidium sp. chipmunk genotype I TaxID=1280935 RepID=UPI00351A91B5|nr:conserved of plant or bacterial origin [Cryptosporidium sp. chipmunk genotype I]
MSGPQKQYDLFIWGSTGFTGNLICDLLVRTYKPGTTNLKYCFGGRNVDRMEALRRRLIETLDKETGTSKGEEMISSVPMFVCNNNEEIGKCIANSKVCINVSGPYTECGEIIVSLCCEHYTHYIDLCGELAWSKRMQRLYGASIASKGLKFATSCGFVSAVIDLGLLHLQNFAAQTSGLPCQEVLHYAQHDGYSQSASYGTVKSVLLSINDPIKDEIKQYDPYGLCNGTLCLSNIAEITEKNRVAFRPVYNSSIQAWTSPNMLSSAYSMYAHFANEEMGYPYGMDFIFSSRSVNKSYLSALTSCFKDKIGRFLSERYIISKMVHCGAPYFIGAGPDVSKARDTVIKSTFVGTTMQGKNYKCVVQARDLENYSVSAVLALACSFSIIFDYDNLPQTSGFSTPSALFGVSAIKQCQDLGIQFEVEHLEK